ncbi:RHS repeat-associated core domain-containing protein [Streptomyces collinus]
MTSHVFACSLTESGPVRPGAPGRPYRFAGNYRGPNGLYHLKARYYDANIGRFTQPDPSGQEKNPYLYAEGDPVNQGLLGLSRSLCRRKHRLHYSSSSRGSI